MWNTSSQPVSTLNSHVDIAQPVTITTGHLISTFEAKTQVKK